MDAVPVKDVRLAKDNGLTITAVPETVEVVVMVMEVVTVAVAEIGKEVRQAF